MNDSPTEAADEIELLRAERDNAREALRISEGYVRELSDFRVQAERLRAALEKADSLLREAISPILHHHDDLGDLAERIVAHINATLAGVAVETSGAPADALEAGWRTAANWMNRDDLISDIGSPAYLADRSKAQRPHRAYYETHEPPHCPTCDCGRTS
jgi:hypothetical protein